MPQKESIMLDRPANRTIASGIGYNILMFSIFPFVIFLVMQGSHSNTTAMSVFEIAYRIINFVAAVSIFRHYLPDSFLIVQIKPKDFWGVVAKSTLLILGISVGLYYVAPYLLNEYTDLGANGIIPLSEMNLFMVSGYLVNTNPVLGTICTALLAPVTVSCLYYAAVFAPIANTRPVLAYFVTAGYIAIPWIWNALGFLIPAEAMVLYGVQLPVHLLACRAYQKADTVWAPIAVLTIVNLISSAVLLIIQALL